MRPLLPILTIILVSGFPIAAAQTNIALLGHLDYQALHGSHINSIWGYTDEEGREYALVGVTGDIANPDSSGGMSIVDVTDPLAPLEVFFLPGPYCTSYEAQVWGDRAYVTSRCGGGLRIIDLSPLPQSDALSVVVSDEIITAHTTFIDEQGRLYVNGGNLAEGGVAMFDLAQDPDTPVFEGAYAQFYVHDCYARGDTLYAANIFDGFFSVIDVSDPTAPFLLGTQYTPDLVPHNLWPDDTGDHLFTTDESEGDHIGSFDITDLSDIRAIDTLRSDEGWTVPHNTYWLNGYLVTSYYTYGVVIYDAQRPANLIEVGHYDTSPLSGGGFFGAWGVYPFFPSGHLIISDMEAGLFILGPDYQRACWLEGVVSNAVTSAPVLNASVTILGPQTHDATDPTGHYATGHAEAGTYAVMVTSLGYLNATVDDVVLVNGEVTALDIELTPLPNTDLEATVRESNTLAAIEGAQVVLAGGGLTYAAISGADGSFLIPDVTDGTYSVTVAHWGHRTLCLEEVLLDGTTPSLVVELSRGYYDDFVFDLGWSVTGYPDSGAWIRDVPVGTEFQGGPSNPYLDLPDDCGDMAFVTGNGTPFLPAIHDRVTANETVLTSPVFDATDLPDPHVRYARWFSDRFGSIRDDTLDVLLTNGTDTARVEAVIRTMPGHATWRTNTVRVMDHLMPTATMRMVLRIADEGNLNVVEAALDRFEVLAEAPVGLAEEAGETGPFIHPNPNNGRFMLTDGYGGPRTVEIRDASGRLVHSEAMVQNTGIILVDGLAPGVYMLSVGTDGLRRSVRMVVDQ